MDSRVEEASTIEPSLEQCDSVTNGQHAWSVNSHSRPTYCNLCREALSGVAWHGISCDSTEFMQIFYSFEIDVVLFKFVKLKVINVASVNFVNDANGRPWIPWEYQPFTMMKEYNKFCAIEFIWH